MVVSQFTQLAANVASRPGLNDVSNRELLHHRHDKLLRTGPLQELLAILLVNKQVYREAMPIFYQENTFFVRLSDRLMYESDLSVLPFHATRALWVGRICMSLCAWHLRSSLNSWIKLTHTLSRLTLIHELMIQLHGSDEDWLERTRPNGAKRGVDRLRKHAHPSMIPGMKRIAAAGSRAKQFVVLTSDYKFNQCPLLVQYLTEGAERLKDAATTKDVVPQSTRKRSSAATRLKFEATHRDQTLALPRRSARLQQQSIGIVI